MIVDTFLVYQFIKKLITPFNQTQAFERGLIDQNGNFLKKRKYFSSDDKKVLGLFDIMIINLKKLIAKIPGGNTRTATIAAALMLLRSDPKKLKEETIINEMFELEEKLHATIKELELIIELLEKTEKIFASLTYDIGNIVKIMTLEQTG